MAVKQDVNKIESLHVVQEVQLKHRESFLFSYGDADIKKKYARM
jgi:hypothetical protein